jgi:AAA family ATP:ADP antiporter
MSSPDSVSLPSGAQSDRSGWLDRVLRLISDVRAGEALTAILFASSLFVGLFAYYVLKTLREPLILATGGAEVRSYATGAQAVVLIVLIPAYGWVARRVDRSRLVLGTSAFFLVCLEAFALLAHFEVPYIGIAFYVWLGVFVLSSVAQVWSLANDLYPRHQGRRLFPIVALGAPLGSALGALAAGHLFSGGLAIPLLMQLAAVLLLLQLALLALIVRRPEAKAVPAQPLEGRGGFALVLSDGYLREIAVLLVVLNLVNTTGEYLLSRAVLGQAAEALAAAGTVADPAAFRADFLRHTYGDFYFVVNVASVLVQALVASRLVSRFGLRGVLFALPLVALGAYGAMAASVSFAVMRALKIAENATDYSLENTAKALLWLPTSRDVKYKAKQTVDAFFVRLGDVLAALVVFVFADRLALEPTHVALVNAGLAILAMGLAVRVARRHDAIEMRPSVP